MGPNYDEVEEEEDGSDKDENSDGEDHGEIQSGITRFAADDGCNAFKMAFKSIMKSKGDDALVREFSILFTQIYLKQCSRNS